MQKTINYILFGLATVFIFFFLIDKIPLWSSDEGRFGEKAREMWQMKDFVVPHFNYITSIEKPVLAYLVTALSYAVFGITSWSARLTSIVSAILGVALCYGFTWKLFNRQTANWASILLITSVGYVLLGRFAMIDMLMTLFLSGTLFCLMTASLLEERKYYFAAYVFMGLAFLAKGLIGILLPGLIFFVFLLWTRNLREITKMHLGWGLLIMGLIIIPWCIAISIKQPDFFDVFIIKNHFSRFATPVFGRKRPLWFFAPVLIAAAFPWTFFIPAAIVKGLKREISERNKIQFLISWIAVIFIFFSIPKSKLPYYMLPLTMPVVILAASFLNEYFLQSNRLPDRSLLEKWTWNLIPLVCFVAFVGINAYLFFPFAKRGEVAVLEPFLQIGSCIFGVGALLTYFFHKKSQNQYAILTLAAMIYSGLIMTFMGMRAISPFQSSYDSAQILKSRAQSNDEVAIYASPDRFSDFMFHLGRRVIVVGSDRGSLALGSQKSENSEEMKKWFLETGVFVQMFNAREKRIVCLLDEKKLQQLKDSGLGNYVTLKAGEGQLLISNYE